MHYILRGCIICKHTSETQHGNTPEQPLTDTQLNGWIIRLSVYTEDRKTKCINMPR